MSDRVLNSPGPTRDKHRHLLLPTNAKPTASITATAREFDVRLAGINDF